MRHLISRIAIASCTLLLTACFQYYEPEPYSGRVLTIENQSGESITWIVPEHAGIACEDMSGDLPQTLSRAIEKEIEANIIPPHSYVNVSIYDADTVAPLEQYHVDDMVTFYFFKTRTLKDNDWGRIVSEEMWLERRPLSAGDVIDMDKTITYKENKH